MKNALPFIPLIVYCIAYLTLFGAWFATVLLQTPGAAQIVSYIHDTLLALTGHVLTVLPAASGAKPEPTPATVPNMQSGRALPLYMLPFLVAISFAEVILVTGCAAQQQVLSGYEAAAVTSIKMAEANNIKTWTLNVCGTPFSATIRHPEIIPAIKALCLPGGQASNPATLFDAAAPLVPEK